MLKSWKFSCGNGCQDWECTPRRGNGREWVQGKYQKKKIIKIVCWAKSINLVFINMLSQWHETSMYLDPTRPDLPCTRSTIYMIYYYKPSLSMFELFHFLLEVHKIHRENVALQIAKSIIGPSFYISSRGKTWAGRDEMGTDRPVNRDSSCPFTLPSNEYTWYPSSKSTEAPCRARSKGHHLWWCCPLSFCIYISASIASLESPLRSKVLSCIDLAHWIASCPGLYEWAQGVDANSSRYPCLHAFKYCCINVGSKMWCQASGVLCDAVEILSLPCCDLSS